MAPHVVVVGSTMIDLLSYSDRIPERGQTVIGQRLQIGHGGKGANQAVMAARLGARVTFVTRIGADVLGEMARENLSAQGLALDRVKPVEGESQGVASIWVEPDGDNRILIVPGANLSLSAGEVAADLAGVDRPDCVMCQLEVPLGAVTAALRWGRDHGAITILNPAPSAPLGDELLELVDWLTPNETEFQDLFGAPPDDDALIRAAAQLGGGLIVTLGARGSATVLDGRVVRLDAPPAHTIDTTGAGDAFMGGLAYALSRGDRLLDAIVLGNRCGALSTEKRGTQTSFPVPSELRTMPA
ncbi:MAG TPA: ribokinase [Solirubrobacteraceae bacterium]|nr:ribokinase [Solirubrobacteraceae bacterium]